MVDSASGELNTWPGKSVVSFCVSRNTPPFGSSTSSPKMMRPGSASRPARSVRLIRSPMRYLPGLNSSSHRSGDGPSVSTNNSSARGFSAASAAA